jgi:hypothetical protein
MNLAAQHALVAGKSFGDGMVVVGAHLLHGAVVGHIDENSAAGLTQPAIGTMFGGHGFRRSRGIRPRSGQVPPESPHA